MQTSSKQPDYSTKKKINCASSNSLKLSINRRLSPLQVRNTPSTPASRTAEREAPLCLMRLFPDISVVCASSEGRAFFGA